MSMQSILSASMSLNRIQTMQSIQSQTEGRINVLNAEIKQDGGHDERKEGQVAELEERSSSIMGNLMGELTDVNESLKPSEDEKTEGTTGDKEPNTDKVEISKPSDGSQEETKAVRGDAPVSYDAEGKVKAEDASPSGKKVDAKV